MGRERVPTVTLVLPTRADPEQGVDYSAHFKGMIGEGDPRLKEMMAFARRTGVGLELLPDGFPAFGMACTVALGILTEPRRPSSGGFSRRTWSRRSRCCEDSGGHVVLGWRSFASLAAIAVAFDAGAASFDCARAARPQEKLVCSDPVLSKLDEQMAASYWAARGLLSEPGRSALLAGQRSWLRYWPRDCSSARGALVFDADAVKCATARYEKRIEALKVDTAFDGRFKVYNVAAYAARWTPSR